MDGALGANLVGKDSGPDDHIAGRMQLEQE
jgi:hypothetical protein